MNRPVAHGAIVLAISLATVGSIVTAQTARASGTTGGPGRSMLGSEAYTPAASGNGVPVRNGSIESDQAAAAARVVHQPTRVQVGAISLEAPVIPVGVDEKSQFDVPAATTVGWYRYGASPGQPGASVLAAHVDYNGAKGAFYDLSRLKAGDRVEVEMDDGATLRFTVTGVYEVQKHELPAEELFRKDGTPVLNLITCGGTFNPQKHSYNANVVVTAEPADAVSAQSLTA